MGTPIDELTLRVEMGQLPPGAVVELTLDPDHLSHSVIGATRYAYAHHLVHFGVWQSNRVIQWEPIEPVDDVECFCGMDQCWAKYAPDATKLSAGDNDA